MQVSRAKLFGTGTALAMIGSGLLGPFILAAEAADEGDIKILETAASAERAAIKAYTDAAATGLLSPAILAVATGFMQDHMAHRDALDGAVKAAGVTPSTRLKPRKMVSGATPVALATSFNRVRSLACWVR